MARILLFTGLDIKILKFREKISDSDIKIGQFFPVQNGLLNNILNLKF